MVGKRFGRLVVVSYAYSNDARYWNCVCDCGELTVIRTALLNDGTVSSCGCGSLEAAKTNFRNSAINKRSKYWPLTRAFKDIRRGMIARCYDPRNKRYINYGGRGITVCDEWRNSPTVFYGWLTAQSWSRGLSIERLDVNGNYCPENCTLIPFLEQQNNTTRSHFIEWNGERKTIADWARKLGVRQMALQHRFDRGWSIERAMSQPFRSWPC